MLPESNYLSVNWQDGMKISTEHFEALENFIRDSIKDAISLSVNEERYGLLPSFSGIQKNLVLQHNIIPGNKLKVVLTSCRAVTRGGVRIERREAHNTLPGINWIEGLYTLRAAEEKVLDVLVATDLFSRVVLGEPDPRELPPRRPYAIPEYQLKIQPHNTPYNSLLALKIAELWVQNGTVQESETYVPPCISMDCHEVLRAKQRAFGEALQRIFQQAVKLLRKLQSGYTLDGVEEENLHNNLKFFTDKLVFFLSEQIEIYEKQLLRASPGRFVAFFTLLAKRIYTALSCMEHDIKESLLKYFQWGTTIEPGAFEKLINETVNIHYKHERIYPAIQQIEKFVNLLDELFKILLNRNFSNYRTNIIVSE